MNSQSKKYYQLANETYKAFTPDFLESSKIDKYLEENAESLLNFLNSYQDQFAEFSRDKEILELGSGLGGLSFHFSKKGFYTLGVDQSPLAIQNALILAKKKELYAKFKVLDVCEDKLDQKFDYLIDSHLYHCLVEDDHRKRYLSFVKNSMKGSSLFFLETMCFHSKIQIPFGYEMDDKGKLYKNINGHFTAYRKIIDSIKLEQELLDSGFKIKYLYYHNELSFNPYNEYENLDYNTLPKTIRLVASK